MNQPHLTPNTGDWHAWNVGMLIVQLQELEFIVRGIIAQKTGSRVVDLRPLQPGQWVPEDQMTNYNSLAAILKKFNA
jgi:hypothetical protein